MVYLHNRLNNFQEQLFPQTITCRAAVAWAAKEDLKIETIEVYPSKKGEVRINVLSTGVSHTDAYTLSGADPNSVFPYMLGHEGGGTVEIVGEDVTSVVPGILNMFEVNIKDFVGPSQTMPKQQDTYSQVLGTWWLIGTLLIMALQPLDKTFYTFTRL